MAGEITEIIDIQPMIQVVRGQQVMIDRDLAMLYGVETRRLNEQVKRNAERFPDDFMFQLNKQEFEDWLEIADCCGCEYPYYAGLCVHAPFRCYECPVVPTA